MSYDQDLGRRTGTLTGAQTLANGTTVANAAGATSAGLLSYDLTSYQGRNTYVIEVTVSKEATLTVKQGRPADSASYPHTLTELVTVASGESYPITRLYTIPAVPSCKAGTVDLSNASGTLNFTLDVGARAQ